MKDSHVFKGLAQGLLMFLLPKGLQAQKVPYVLKGSWPKGPCVHFIKY